MTEGIIPHINFNNHNCFIRVPFAIYADFESLTEPIDTCKPRSDKSFTNQYQKHKPCGFGYHIICFNDKLYSQEPVIYRANNEDDDVAQIVVENLKKTSRRFIRNLTLQKICPSNTKIGVSSRRQGDAGSVRVHLTRTK